MNKTATYVEMIRLSAPKATPRIYTPYSRTVLHIKAIIRRPWHWRFHMDGIVRELTEPFSK